MSILILNRIDLRFIPYNDLLSCTGEDVYMISDASAVPPGDLESHAARYKHLETVADYEAGVLVDNCAIALHEKVHFRRIVAVSEFDLLRAAHLRDILGIEGQSYASALAFRDKVHMKSLAARGGIHVPPFCRVAGPRDVLEFVDRYGLPIVIKPLLGAGSSGITIVCNREELHAALDCVTGTAGQADSALEVEQFIAGPMYHMNGFVYEGQLVANWPSRYVNDCRSFLDGKVQGSYTLCPSNPMVSRLQGFVEDLLCALPTPRTTAFHAEAFHTADDDILLCEIASRVAGPMVPEQFRLAFDFDLREAFVRGQAGCPVVLPTACGLPRPRQVGGELIIPNRAGTLRSAPSSCALPGVVDYQLHGIVGQTRRAASDINDFVATFVLAAPTEDEMIERITAAEDWFGRETTWT